MSEKKFEDLTDEELAALEARDWTEAEILRAMRLALAEGEMRAVVDLLARLARKNVRTAALVLAAMEAGR